MMRPLQMLLVCCAVVNGLPVARNAAAEPAGDFAAAKQSFLRETKKKLNTERAAAVTALAAYPEKETAELIWKRACGDNDPLVDQACLTALFQLVEHRAPRSYLFEELQRQVKRGGNLELGMELFRVLSITTDEEFQPELVKILDDHYVTAKSNLLLPMTVIDEFGKQGDASAVRAIELFSRAKGYDALFGYRRCVVQAMIRARDPGAIDFLIRVLPRTKGLIQYDIIQHLTQATGQKFRDLDRDWTKWWSESKATFKFAAVGAPVSKDPLDDKLPTYYNIPICAKRIVFVLDTSMSMRGEPIVVAKQALLKTLEILPEEVNFGLVFFDRDVTVCSPRLVPATLANRQEAAQMVINRELKIGTVSNAALNAALRLEPEVIYFLSDGEPTDGNPLAITSSLTQLNRTRRVSIHTIGVVTIRNGGAGLTMFMQPLAEQNWGTFRLVE